MHKPIPASTCGLHSTHIPLEPLRQTYRCDINFSFLISYVVCMYVARLLEPIYPNLVMYLLVFVVIRCSYIYIGQQKYSHITALKWRDSREFSSIRAAMQSWTLCNETNPSQFDFIIVFTPTTGRYVHTLQENARLQNRFGSRALCTNTSLHSCSFLSPKLANQTPPYPETVLRHSLWYEGWSKRKYSH